MYSSFEDCFGCESSLERIELLIKIILKKEGVQSVKVLRKIDTMHIEDGDSIGIVDVECLCDVKNTNVEIISITDEDMLEELTKDLEEYKDLVASVKTYSKRDDIISKYDKDKYLNSIKKYESSTY